MEWVRLSYQVYGGVEYIKVRPEGRLAIQAVLERVEGCGWNDELQCWLFLFSRRSYEQIKTALRGIALIDNTELKAHLLEKQHSKKEEVSLIKAFTLSQASVNLHRLLPATDRRTGIDPVNWHVLVGMEERLKLKAYSKSTIKTYLNEMTPLLRIIGLRPVDELSDTQIKRYLVYCYEKLLLSENTLHSRINALKFYFEQVLGRERFFWDIPRPKRHMQLPKLLNEDELMRLFNALRNKKHKAMLFTAYSAGLRVSEVVNLRLEDIDSGRMQMFVTKAKGKKDRYVNLSPVLLDILREYVRTYLPRPRKYLFESGQTMNSYPVRTVQQIFTNAKVRAGIRKQVGIHSLRHSFATHLLDKGTDIKYIKDLLGHFNIKTTERYLHVTKRQLVNIISPFDDLFRSKDIEW